MAYEHDQIPEIALAWHREGRGAALATVVQTWGSAPRQVGSQLAVSGRGDIAGSVSGGCVEGAVVAEALDCLDTGNSVVLDYGVSDDEAFAVGLPCGGRIRVMVEPIGAALHEEMLAALVARRATRSGVGYLVNTDSWGRQVVSSDDAAFARQFQADASGFLDDKVSFLAIHNAPLRMVVVGAVHIAQPLLSMARLAGFDPVLVDPREAFASNARFPGETLIHDWPDEALTAFGLDRRTAVVTLTHDPKIDDPAITTALTSDVFYLGSLGSRRTHGKRVERLQQAGFSEAQIARIHAPVGLDIGAKTPAEIAISIMAEITQRLRSPA